MAVDHVEHGAGAAAESVWLTWNRGQLVRESFWMPMLSAAIGVGILAVVPGLGLTLLLFAGLLVVVSSATYWCRLRQGLELTAERFTVHRGGIRDKTLEMRWSDITAITVDGAIVVETPSGRWSLPAPRGRSTKRHVPLAGEVLFDDDELDGKVRTLSEWWTRAR